MILTTNTLFDISRHTNKTIKLADYLAKAGQPILFNKMAMVDQESSEIAFIEAFNSDIIETTKKISDMHALLSTVDENGNVIHLKGEKSLSKIFGEHYNKIDQTIEFPFGKINLKKDFSREDCQNQIVEKFLKLNEAEYKRIFKARNKIFKHSKDQLYTDEDKIEFLSTVTERNKYDNAITAIKNMSAEYTDFRKHLTLENKSIIDDQITFQRSMIDSITKDSTYITKLDQFVQISSPHKKQKELLNLILEELKENKLIDSVEIDKDTDLNAFLNMMQQIKDIKFNVAEAVSLKARKLGNYNANGLFYVGANIVAVDVKNPSAAVHEMVHAVDLKNENIRNSVSRKNFASVMRGYLTLDSGYTEKQINYYNSTAEIIARAGEISFIFEKYDFKPEEESVIEFAERVSPLQKQENPYDLNLAKNIKFYTEEYPSIYFNLKDMNVDDLTLMKEYYKSYFRVKEELKIEPLKQVAELDHKEHKVIGTKTRYKISPVGLITHENIVNLMEYNEKNKIIDPTIIIRNIFENSTKLNRTTKTISNDDVRDQIKIFENLVKWVDENDNLYLLSRMMEEKSKLFLPKNNTNIFLIDEFLNNNLSIELDINKDFKNFEDSIGDLISKYKEIEQRNDNNRYKDLDTLSSEYKLVSENTLEYSTNTIKDILMRNEKRVEMLKKSKETIKLPNDRVLNSYSIGKRFGLVDKLMQKKYDEHGEKIFSYFKKEDMAPLLLIYEASDNSRTKQNVKVYLSEKSRLEKDHQCLSNPLFLKSKSLLELINKNGLIDGLKSNENDLNILMSANIKEEAFLSYYRNIRDVQTILDRKESILQNAITINRENLIPFNNIDDFNYTLENIKDHVSGTIPDYEKTQKTILEYENSFKVVDDTKDLSVDNTIKQGKLDESIISKINDKIGLNKPKSVDVPEIKVKKTPKNQINLF